MSKMKMVFALSGPLKGRTMNINGNQFVNGRLVVEDVPEAMGGLVAYLMHYQAYSVGSEQHLAAMERDNDQRDIQAGGPQQVQSQTLREGDWPPALQAENSDGNGDGDADQSDADPSGSGHEDSGLAVEQESDGQDDSRETTQEQLRSVSPKLVAAIEKLDPMADEHWTEEGFPAMSAVEEALGSTGITRRDVEAAVPGYNRQAAMGKTL